MKIFLRNYALLALASGLGYLSFTAFPGSAEFRDVQSLLQDFDASAVAELRFGRGEASTTLRRTESGWAVDDLFGAPASKRTIETVLQRMGSITDQDLLTGADGTEAQASDAYALGVDEALRITASDGGGGTIADLLVARAPGPGWTAFARRVGSGAVVRTRFFEVPVDPKLWVARAPLVMHSALQVRDVQVTGPLIGDPLLAQVPKGLVSEFADGAGQRLGASEMRRLLESLRVIPQGVVGRVDGDLPEGVLSIAVTPLVGPAYELRVLGRDGDAEADSGAAPGKIFRVDTGIVYAVPPSRIDQIVASARAARDSSATQGPR